MTNHPVHILDHHGQLSTTALIPFCELGGDSSVMGVKIDQFDSPVCNSFKDKILMDQMCYTVDPNKYINSIKRDFDLSLTLFLNYNEDRQISKMDLSSSKKLESTLNETFIIVETIGTCKQCI